MEEVIEFIREAGFIRVQTAMLGEILEWNKVI